MLPLFSDPRLFEELFCSNFKWTSSVVSGLNQLTNTRNYTLKESLDFGNPKKLKFLTICVLFRVLKRLEEEEGGGGGGGYRYRLCDTRNEAKVPS